MSFLDEDFLLTGDEAVALYHDYAEDEPILDFHNHLPPGEIAEDRRFSNLSEIWLEGDHYKWRAMRANGTSEELVTGDGNAKEKYLAWAATIPHTLGNPLYHWTHLELKRCFGIDLLLGPDTAEEIWDRANEQLAYPSFSARGMLRRFQVKALCTTDDPADPTDHHQAIRENPEIETAVYPTFRPDKAWGIGNANAFGQWLQKLEGTTGLSITNLDDFVAALEKRVEDFHELGSRISDHSFPYFFCDFPNDEDAKRIFQNTLDGKDALHEEEEEFGAFVMLRLARLYAEKGWTMQVHLGPLRNNSSRLLKSFGPDAGTDSVGDWPQAERMSHFLDCLDREDSLPKTIVYNNNPSDNFTVAAMLGNFQGGLPGKMQFGSGWWHLDQRDGMEEQLKTLANLGLLSRFVGMLTDSRSFLSFPRHEYFRRILCNLLGGWMKDGFVPNEPEMIGDLVQRICYQNACEYLDLELPAK
ncbi:MAG: glucuronate isomerase [Opitutales bacterium]